MQVHSALRTIGFAVALLGSSTQAEEHWRFSRVEMAPLNTLQLGDAALVSPEVLESLSAEGGGAAELSAGENRAEVLLYPIGRPVDTVSMKKALRDRLGVEPGDAAVTLRLLAPGEGRLEPVDKPIRIESQPGDGSRWPGFVVGAPHGDCDMFTGEIVAETTRQCGVSSVCAYGSRISYLGRWIDVNRPLQRRPRPQAYGILPYRDWTAEAVAIFSEFKTKALAVGARPEVAQGAPPLDLYLDFHGHDLSVTDENGKKLYRNVFECMARGFSLEEVRVLKSAFDRCVAEEYGDEAPPSHWGNLPEDRRYDFNGYPADFFYSGLGARVYGVLASDVARRAIHIESPNSVRLEASQRPRTARVLSNFVKQLRDELVPASLARQSDVPPATGGVASGQWVRVPAGDFLMGAPREEGWSVEHPQHWVHLEGYKIGVTEVTCGEYARFLNEELAAGRAELSGAEVHEASTGQTWCVLSPERPLAMLARKNDRVVWSEGREHHPVNCVTWRGATAMAEAQGASLPTEAQWERAAGWDAETERVLRTGLSQARFSPTVAATLMNSGGPSEDYVAPSTTPVGFHSESRSPAGCYDMSGNVWEWTLDWHGDYEDTADTQVNPTGPAGGTMKVIRGGGWDTERQTATPSFRLGVSPDRPLPNVGFRLVRPARGT
ncbi:formylglycine-generating enzyme family protein [Pseudobythopirellula maris]|nr:SUMF1/EgtB/PvdO family nonheme iron enzyme [Pseudobythopirellula maris]